ncbi:M20 family metallopeptidase [Roseibium sp. MMSF_3412]|uniref:M20 family metallopeptidase n=1 Tax=Roseibium sp. MMSF_3412 TaxID=3046712 RepID=UPI00273ECFF4|nr:M20 family metallopeptidase [Roseibium sp. MMSF_3412]
MLPRPDQKSDLRCREAAVASAALYIKEARFKADLERLVACRTETSRRGDAAQKQIYLSDIIAPELAELGFETRIYDNPDPGSGPLAIYKRIENPKLPTVLLYGHGDVVPGQEGEWDADRSPWKLEEADGRLYGRGTADNKGQHWINIAALRQVLATRGRLGFNCKILLEMEEESGSPGLEAFCRTHKDELAADLLIASDGPRIRTDRPTVALGSRGNFNFDLEIRYRNGGRHSGNWGGSIKDPVIRLAHAISTITDDHGRILIQAWRPQPPTERIRGLLKDCPILQSDGVSRMDADWGETNLEPAERVLAWNNFAVLAIKAGSPERPVNAIAPMAWARCQLRFLAGLDPETILPALRSHLDAHGFEDVVLSPARSTWWRGTTTDPDNQWVQKTMRSLERTEAKTPDLIPCIGGSLPNHAFQGIVGMPTVWVPHSYSDCSQHAPNEHVRIDLCLSAIRVMTGLFWDIGREGEGEG